MPLGGYLYITADSRPTCSHKYDSLKLIARRTGVRRSCLLICIREWATPR